MDASASTSSALSPTPAEVVEMNTVSRFLVDAETQTRFEISEERVLANTHNYLELEVPIHRLPLEILTRIFVINCAGVRLMPMPDVFSISQVCRRWREILLSTALFWSDFRVSGTGYDLERKEGQAELAPTVRLFLERSKNHPLTLVFLVLSEDFRREEYKIPEHLSLLVESAERWKDVRVYVEDFVHPIFGLLLSSSSGRTRLSSLQSLGLTGDKYHDIPQPFDIFEHCESLISVRLDTLSSQWLSLRLPWKQLTTLHVSHIDSSTQVLLLLRECPRLRSLTLGACDFYSIPPLTSPTIITLSNLESLSMPNCNHVSVLVGHVTLPRLSTLRVQDAKFDPVVPVPEQGGAFVEFLRRSACTITHLAFWLPESESVRVEDIVSFLRLFPFLRTFELEALYPCGPWNAYDNIMEIDIGIVLTALASAALPRLGELRIDARWEHVFERLCDAVLDDQLVALLRGLIIWIETLEPATELDLESLRRLWEVGVRVDMVYNDIY
ncbi:hypothetical protein V5O48_012930 [Marasmius crinis-equi]|uniref:F-box domain-containing protein n=1 Tax=Marasmius crinis-equi TaxID=585013 RepID=A0ABR3F1H5_9AGAR